MSKKSKIIIIVVAAVLVVAIITGLVIFLSGNDSDNTSSSPTNNVEEIVEKIEIDKDDVSLTVNDIETGRGKTFVVPVMLNNNPGIAASAIEFLYNTDKLTYVGYEEGEVFENYHFKTTGKSIQFSNIENGDSKKTGLMFNLKFRVKDDAVLGDTEIKVNVTKESFINFDEEFIIVKGGNAVVTIK